ncbi:putative membrane protein insertion efficiency factor [Clostridia bacterium]|nr:putative membrane protein insertion efficiency factor [Clostridia bacterium]
MIRRGMLAAIRFYRRQISPYKRPSCRFVPTCSVYALEAVEKYGALKGGGMTACRILRCNPFSKGGYDPVP